MSTEHPGRQCDLIMKGGITSGVVYPLAVCELARHYRLRSIGGASAGAIAAACAAAAELGRDSGGYDKLAQLPQLLAQPDASGEPLLSRLFAPSRPTRHLFGLLQACLSPERPRPWALLGRIGWALGRHYPLWMLLGLTLGLLATFALVDEAGLQVLRPGALALGLLLTALALLVSAVIGVALDLLRTVPGNLYGICTGLDQDGGGLTPWLHAQIQRMAGRGVDDPPVTFGDLWDHPVPPAADLPAGAGIFEASRGIDLQLMTTSLVHGRPYTWPLEHEEFHYQPAVFQRLFPASILRWLQRHARPSEHPVDGAVAMPLARDLPILVPVRMSLAFPLLLSAVPLWRLRHGGKRQHQPERVWFSDGGICSNFPIHLFDALLPARPTFGIDLQKVAPSTLKPDDSTEAHVWMPAHNNDGQQRDHLHIDGTDGAPSLLRFLGAVFRTMHQWVDQSQLSIPGFRDRIARVLLHPHEGGMNLRMSGALIQRLAQRGRVAGALLARRFVPELADPDERMGWRNHRWIRFRSAMRLLERMFDDLLCADELLQHDPDAVLQLLQAQPPSYKPTSAGERKRMQDFYRQLLRLAQRQRAERAQTGGSNRKVQPLFRDDHSPRPLPHLRIRPRL